jgi:hypothetical protein
VQGTSRPKVSVATLAKDAAIILRMGFFLSCVQMPARACIAHGAKVAEVGYNNMSRALESCSDAAGGHSNQADALGQLAVLFKDPRAMSRARAYCAYMYTEHERLITHAIMHCKFENLSPAQRQNLPSRSDLGDLGSGASLLPICVWMWDETQQTVACRSFSLTIDILLLTPATPYG